MASYPHYWEFSFYNFSKFSRTLPKILLNHSWDSPISFKTPQTFIFRQFISFFIPFPLYSISYEIVDEPVPLLHFHFNPFETFLPPYRLSS